jgi:hypothetical protein
MCSKLMMEDTPRPHLITLVRQALEELAGRPAGDPATVLEEAWELGRALDIGEAALAVLVAAADSSGACKQEGYPATVSWLRTDLGMTHGRAGERVTLARQLSRLKRTSTLLSQGELSVGYAREICGAVARLDDADALVAEEILLGMVESQAGVREVAKAATRITDLVRQHQGRDPEPEDGRRDERRSWLRHSRSVGGGSFVKGWLSALDEATVAQIIDPLTKPAGKDDPRDAAERQADALMSVLAQGGRHAGVTVIAHLSALNPDTNPPCHADNRHNDSQHNANHHGEQNDSHRSGGGSSSGSSDRLHSHSGGQQSGPGKGSDHSDDQHGGSQHSGSRQSGSSRSGSLGSVQSSAFRSTDGPSHHSSAAGRTAAAADPPFVGRAHSQHSERPANDHGASKQRESEQRESDHGGSEQSDRGRGAVAPASGRGWSAGRRAGARLLDGTPLSPAQARRVALAGGINLLLLGNGGHPLYLGRQVRCVTPAQRKVLEALYPTCAVAGCEIPTHLCEIHHLGGGWKFGTPTNIDQLVPACRFHNQWIEDHPHHTTETRDNDGRTRLLIQRLRHGTRPTDSGPPRSPRPSTPPSSANSSA